MLRSWNVALWTPNLHRMPLFERQHAKDNVPLYSVVLIAGDDVAQRAQAGRVAAGGAEAS